MSFKRSIKVTNFNVFLLERHFPPIFSLKLSDVKAIEQDEVGFVCRIHGKPIPDVTWLESLNGDMIFGRAGGSFSTVVMNVADGRLYRRNWAPSIVHRNVIKSTMFVENIAKLKSIRVYGELCIP